MAEFVIFKPLYGVGDQVEVLYNGKWEEGVVIAMRRMGFIEYDIRLSIGVIVNDVQALSMRKVGAPASQSSRSGPVDVITSSYPEASIPYAFSQDILINPQWVDNEDKTGASRDVSGSPEIPYPATSEVIASESRVGDVGHGPPAVTRRFCPDRNVEAAVSFIVENIDNIGQDGDSDTSKQDAVDSRFPDISEEDLDALANNSRSPNTHRATMWGVGVFREEISRQISETGACHVFTEPRYLYKVRDAVSPDHFMKCCFVIGEAEGCISYDELLQDDASEYPVTIFNVRKDIALLPFSSGTTGYPKAVKLTHYNMVYHMCQLLHPDLCFLSKSDMLVNILSMSHSFTTIVYLIMALICGCTTIVVKTGDLVRFIACLEKYKPTVLHIIPPIINDLLLMKVPASSFSSVHTVTSTASVLDPELEQKLLCILPAGARIRQIYGMTECGVMTMCPETGSSPSSVGSLIPNISAKVVQQEDGHDCEPGEPGELLIKGHHVMSGYLNQPDRTNDSIRDDGWVHTGDIVKYDKDHFFYFIDRLKDIIKYEGLQVSPAELERILRAHPQVVDAAVVGVAVEVVGEVPKAFVVKKADSDITGEALAKYIEDLVAPSKMLRGGVEFIDSIPKLSSGKILRHRLRRREIEKQGKPTDTSETDRGPDTSCEFHQEILDTEYTGEENVTGMDIPIQSQPPHKRPKYDN